ncbi:MAG TPA: hypothetical protein PLV31_06610 [Gammaproteobacteria bacterium]|nr:hypothetical protein [Gammaproteobacteria bacterium]
MARDLNDTFILPSGTERLRNLCCYFFIGLDWMRRAQKWTSNEFKLNYSMG